MTSIDFTSDTGRKALERLRSEQIVWMTTVREDGAPQPSPVWFLLQEDHTVLVFSQPNAPKVRAIQRNPHISLNFNSGADGDEIVIVNGHAVLADPSLTVSSVDAFVDKYDAGIKRLEMTAEQMAAEYSQPIVITLSRLRGW